MTATNGQYRIFCDPARFIRAVKEIDGYVPNDGAFNLIHHPDEPGGVYGL